MVNAAPPFIWYNRKYGRYEVYVNGGMVAFSNYMNRCERAYPKATFTTEFPGEQNLVEDLDQREGWDIEVGGDQTR